LAFYAAVLDISVMTLQYELETWWFVFQFFLILIQNGQYRPPAGKHGELHTTHRYCGSSGLFKHVIPEKPGQHQIIN